MEVLLVPVHILVRDLHFRPIMTLPVQIMDRDVQSGGWEGDSVDRPLLSVEQTVQKGAHSLPDGLGGLLSGRVVA